MSDRIINIVTLAASVAERLHRGQVRKYTGAPYITHPMRVAGRVSLLFGADDGMVAAAWLHDTLEDCDVNREQLAELFGGRVAHIVAELTNPSKQHLALSRPERKAMDREHLKHASQAAQTLKALDRIDNLIEAVTAPESFWRMYVDESRQLAAVLKPGIGDELYEQLMLVCRDTEFRGGRGEQAVRP